MNMMMMMMNDQRAVKWLKSG